MREIPQFRGALEARIPLADPGPGHRWLVEVAACAGRGQMRLGDQWTARFPWSWTPRRLRLPRTPDGTLLHWEVETEGVEAACGRPFLAEIGQPPRGAWAGVFLRRTGPAAFLSRPRVRLEPEGWHVDCDWEGPPDTRVVVHGPAQLPRWSPEEPERARIRVELWAGGRLSDRELLWGARRELRAEGERLSLEGHPFRIRGLLHWGAWPDGPGPDPPPRKLRGEFRSMRARGFNLLKCCLWLPPHRFLETCDRAGMPLWIEYPLWRKALDAEVADDFAAFFAHDSSHPCVLIRSLSCENDERDPKTARELVAAARAAAPGALAEDNSAWLGCTHAADFHDEHPYLNCAQWPFFLERTRRALAGLPRKPLLLGETLAVDAPAGDRAARRLAMAVRRRQIRELRKVFPEAGYVLCAARDLASAPIGVQDRNGRWKDPPSAWAWQREASESTRKTVFPRPLPPMPEVRFVSVLDPEVLAYLRSGGTVLHLAGPRAGSWRAPEWTFWSAAVELRGGARDRPLASLLRREALLDLLSGRRLVPHPGMESWVGIADLHDAPTPRPPAALVLVGRVGRGRLMVSSLRPDTPAGRRAHQLLAHRLLRTPASALSRALLPPPPRSFHLSGPWELSGPTVRGGRTLVRVGTPLANQGANLFQGEALLRAHFTLPADWTGPVLLHATAIADGWQLDTRCRGSGVSFHARFGNLDGTWDSGRDIPRTLDLSGRILPGVQARWQLRVQDHRGAGTLVGPLYLCDRPPESSPLG